MIRIERLVKRYGRLHAVDGLSLEVEAGECVGLVGPNGAGKSTTLKSVVGLVRPTSGRVLVAGCDVTREPRAARTALGYLPQGVQFPGGFRVIETVTLYATVRGLRDGWMSAFTALDRVGLRDAVERDVAALSGGMRQRLGLAVAFLGDPRVLVLDEPTVSLDPEASMGIRDVLAAQRGAGRTILISSHVLAELETLVDRVAFLHAGRLVALGTLTALERSLGLAARMQVDAGEAAARAAEAARLAGGTEIGVAAGRVELRVPADRKLAVLDAMRAVAPLGDVSIEPTRLEDVYRRVLERVGDAA